MKKLKMSKTDEMRSDMIFKAIDSVRKLSLMALTNREPNKEPKTYSFNQRDLFVGELGCKEEEMKVIHLYNKKVHVLVTIPKDYEWYFMEGYEECENL